MDKFQEAFDILDDCINTLRKFECGTGTLPSCPLLQADELKYSKIKQDKLLNCTVAHDPPPGYPAFVDIKKACTGPTVPTSDELAGILIFNGKLEDIMSSINKSNPVDCLCASCRCDGKHCTRSASCKMNPDLDITKWPDTTFAKRSILVNRMPSLELNKAVINHTKLATRTAKLASSTLTTAIAPTTNCSNKA